MNTLLLPVRHPLLSQYIQSFLFFKRTAAVPFSYTTFPNTNLCLALYKNNQVTYSVTESINHCQISASTNRFSSRLYGFHKRPFTVGIEGPLDQVCILFRAGGLRAFTREHFAQLARSTQVVHDLFQHTASQWLDQLFETDDAHQRVAIIEAFLLRHLSATPINLRVKTSLQLIEHSDRPMTIKHLSASLGIDESTVYRLFLDHIGQSPKAYCQTVRFRQILTSLLAGSPDTLTQLAYTHDYFDQAHFGKHLKQVTGYSPGQLDQKLSIEQKELIWMTSSGSLA